MPYTVLLTHERNIGLFVRWLEGSYSPFKDEKRKRDRVILVAAIICGLPVGRLV